MDSNMPPENVPQAPYGAPATPPPFNRPPPVISAMTTPPRKRYGWMIFAIVLLVLLMLSMLMNLGAVMSTVTGGAIRPRHTLGPQLEEFLVRENSGDDKIAVVPVEGIITGDSIDGNGLNMVSIIKEQLKRAGKDQHVKAVILKVNSPGGEVLASDEIANAVREFQAKHRKPVVASMGSLAASGGYYVSAPCEWIVANELTITGSIGVIMSGFNYRGLLDKVGVHPEVFKSGRYKDMLSGTKPPGEITPEERQMVQTLIDETFQKFKVVVRDGRTDALKRHPRTDPKLSQGLKSDWTEYADGRILSGSEAKRLGFVDELGNFDDAVRRAETLASIRGADIVQYQPLFDLSSLFRLFGKSETRTIKVDVGMDFPKLNAHQLYFLPSMYVQ